MEKIEFEAIVRKQPGLGGYSVGKITSRKLAELIGKKVRIVVKVL